MTLGIRKVEEGSPIEGFVSDLYAETFDRRRHVPISSVLKAVSSGKAEVLAFFDTDLFAGFCISYLSSDDVYLCHLAVVPVLRNRGYGTEMADILKERYSGRRIVVGVEAPSLDDKLVSSSYRRLGFFTRNGFKDCVCKYESVGVTYEVVTYNGDADSTTAESLLRGYRRACGIRR